MGDTNSAKMIFASDIFPAGPSAWRAVLKLLPKTSLEIVRLTAEALLQRRLALSKYAAECLTQTELIDLNISENDPIDFGAVEAYEKLLAGEMAPPRSADPALHTTGFDGSIYINEVSIYHIFASSQDPPSRQILDIFYGIGFTNVDSCDTSCDTYGTTPLVVLSDFRLRSWNFRTIDLIRWFLEKGASPTFHPSLQVPNLLFGAAVSFRRHIATNQSHIPGLDQVILQSSLLANPLSTDTCQCFCSSEGCQPCHMLWRCAYIGDSHQSCSSLSCNQLIGALGEWVNLCRIESTDLGRCFEEMCRLEVFDRLGMVHTCCTQSRSSMDPRDQAERERLAKEDSELNTQLELILLCYRSRSKHEQGKLPDIWTRFIHDLDEILPEPKSQERCRFQCLSFQDMHHYKVSAGYEAAERRKFDSRFKIQEETLTRRGYSGWNFLDVIQDHFSKDLQCISEEQPVSEDAWTDTEWDEEE